LDDTDAIAWIYSNVFANNDGIDIIRKAGEVQLNDNLYLSYENVAPGSRDIGRNQQIELLTAF